MQAEAAAAEVAGGRGQHADEPRSVEQSDDDARDHRQTEEEAHVDRDDGTRGVGEGVHAKSQAHVGGDLHAGRQFVHGEGGGARVVLQPATEGEEDQSAVGGDGIAVLGGQHERRHVRHRQFPGQQPVEFGDVVGTQFQSERDGEAGMTQRQLLRRSLHRLMCNGMLVM